MNTFIAFGSSSCWANFTLGNISLLYLKIVVGAVESSLNGGARCSVQMTSHSGRRAVVANFTQCVRLRGRQMTPAFERERAVSQRSCSFFWICNLIRWSRMVKCITSLNCRETRELRFSEPQTDSVSWLCGTRSSPAASRAHGNNQIIYDSGYYSTPARWRISSKKCCDDNILHKTLKTFCSWNRSVFFWRFLTGEVMASSTQGGGSAATADRNKTKDFQGACYACVTFHCLFPRTLWEKGRSHCKIGESKIHTQKITSCGMRNIHFHDLLSSCLNLVSRSVSWRKAFVIFFDLTGCRISTHLCSKATSSSLASILGVKNTV